MFCFCQSSKLFSFVNYIIKNVTWTFGNVAPGWVCCGIPGFSVPGLMTCCETEMLCKTPPICIWFKVFDNMKFYAYLWIWILKVYYLYFKFAELMFPSNIWWTLLLYASNWSWYQRWDWFVKLTLIIGWDCPWYTVWCVGSLYSSKSPAMPDSSNAADNMSVKSFCKEMYQI